ncbi:MAG TPA: bacteriohopanetetrol glucosamine biosynthesis glycosyltransferase HpnI [Steroidobacteraceae bacterium]|nr:bacteriohopanetetrol glucosamine biosynthesis glycosyltransferase HpnI [Steroidobacteraceae bacterium]
MSLPAASWLVECGTVLAALAMGYSVMACLAVRRRARTTGGAPANAPAVTVLKPLCGEEHGLYECLRSFCEQDYPHFQIVFGVSNSRDPAVAVVRRLKREFPAMDLKIAIDGRQHGSSPKVSNLINMMPLASYGHLVIADSDVRVTRSYLATVVAPLLDPGVGIVTCGYRGRPRAGLWSLLGCLFINEWFMPSVCVAAMAGSRSFAFGATIAIRRDVLDLIGGFESIANQLADDYRLGELTRRMGLRTVLSEVVVDTYVGERNLGELLEHELRWLRTIRAVRPVGHALSFITFGIPVAAIGSLLAGGAPPALAMLAVTAGARILLHFTVRKPGSARSHLPMLLLRDTLTFVLWSWSFATRTVRWRNEHFRVTRNGAFEPLMRMTR